MELIRYTYDSNPSAEIALTDAELWALVAQLDRLLPLAPGEWTTAAYARAHGIRERAARYRLEALREKGVATRRLYRNPPNRPGFAYTIAGESAP